MPAGIHLKRQLNVRLSEEAHSLIRFFSDTQQLSQAQVLEVALREYARGRGVKISEVRKQLAYAR